MACAIDCLRIAMLNTGHQPIPCSRLLQAKHKTYHAWVDDHTLKHQAIEAVYRGYWPELWWLEATGSWPWCTCTLLVHCYKSLETHISTPKQII